jgi:phosphotriesterase-related protein
MPEVQTVRGPVDIDALGITLMHEHVFVLSEEVRQNYPAGWNEDERVDDAIVKLDALAALGCQTIADPSVLGLGRDIHRIRRVADGTGLNIIVATGLYTYDKIPHYFEYRVARNGGIDPLAQLFIDDITTGIAGTGVKAAFLKCAIDEPGLTPGVERVLRAVGRAHAETGDLDYLAELADAGCVLGMDRFGLDVITPFEDRVGTVAALCERGYAPSMVLSHDASCYIDWFPPEIIPVFAPRWNFQHLFEDVLPALRDRGVTAEQIDAMMVVNPRRYFSGR